MDTSQNPRQFAEQPTAEQMQNHLAAERFGHLPTPAGAERTFDWQLGLDGAWSREFSGPPQRVAGVVVGVEGVQHADASTERFIWLDVGTVASGVGGRLDAREARILAAALIQLADGLDRAHTGTEGA
jgi:hypothetical protein